MLGPRSSRFYGAALQSGLIDEAGLKACWDLIAPERRTPDAIDRRLARQTIATGRITLWQAQQLLAGRISGYFIDKYILLSLLGRGGMGRVYLARDVRLNRTVALKLLSQERMNNPRAIARFRREAKVGAQLQHENLVRVYDEGESAGILYLVMEHIDGKNVGQTIGEMTRIPWPMAARLARQVALGLEHARLKGLIHRDVNPGNILITQDGTAKLTDLGLAIDLNDLDNVTREGATVGTFDYVSPEQAKNSRSVDTRADLYSLGCTLFHMIAGRVPFPMASLPEKLYAHQLHDPEPITDLVPDVPEGLAEVIRRLMRKLPDERFQTPAELAQALEPFAIETGWTMTPAVNGPGDSGIESGGSVRSGSGEGPSVVIEGSSMGLTSLSPTTPTSGGGESFFPLDLGPEEPLAGHLHKPTRTRTSSPGPEEVVNRGPEGESNKPPRRVRVKLVAILAFAVILAAGLIAVVAGLISSRSTGQAAPPLTAGSDRTDKSRDMTIPPPGPNTPPLAAGPVVVRFRDRTSEAAADLGSALARAVRDRAEVILAAGTTVRLANDASLRIPDGSVTIRGPGTGTPPTIEITVKGSQPAILARANLELADLIVNVKAEGPTDAPVWQAERDFVCKRCVFRLIGPNSSADEMPTGSKLILAEGPKLTITGCLFAGFDRPIEFSARPNASASLDQSIFVTGPPGVEAPLGGQCLMIRSAYGGGAGVKLKVSACSARSRVFLAVDQFAPGSPLAVDVTDSALWTSALLQIETLGAAPGPEGGFAATPAEKPTWPTVAKAVNWHGQGNHFFQTPEDAPWARLASPDPLSDAPATLEAWSMNDRETKSETCQLQFANPPTPDAPPTQ